MKIKSGKMVFTGSMFLGLLMFGTLTLAQENLPEQANPRSMAREEIREQKKEDAMARKEGLVQERDNKKVKTEKGIGEVDGIRHEKGAENSRRGRENKDIDHQMIRERKENQLERRQGIRERSENAEMNRRR
jgi:hypothetical protein